MTRRQTRQNHDDGRPSADIRSSLPALAVRLSEDASDSDQKRLHRIASMVETDGASAWFFALNGSWALDLLDIEEERWTLHDLGVKEKRRLSDFAMPKRDVMLNHGFSNVWCPVPSEAGTSPFREIGRILQITDERTLGDFTIALKASVSKKKSGYLASALRSANRRLGIDNAMIVFGSIDQHARPTGLIVLNRDPNMRFDEDGSFVVNLDYDVAVNLADASASHVLECQAGCIALQAYLDMKRLSQSVRSVGLVGNFNVNLLFPEGCLSESEIEVLVNAIGNAVWLHDQVVGPDNEGFVYGATHTVEYVLGE